VVDEDHVVGMITDRDLVVRVIAKRPDPNAVRAVALSPKREVGIALEHISQSESTTNLNDGPAIGTPRHATGLSR
jgi:CBS domain-containing protein